MIGLLCSWVAMLCWNQMSQRLPSGLGGQLIVFESISAVVYALIWRGEWPTITMVIGFTILLVGVMCSLYVFGKSGIGTLLAISGAEFLKDLGMPSAGSLLGIIIFTGMLNLLITSATSKWAILSTIFVPMLMMLGISPELTQAAFRVSDSAVNVCTPMFPFYPLLIMYCQKYCKQAGVGTLSSMMIPYTLALLVALTFVLYAFWGIGIPIGFDSGYVYPPVK